MRSAAAVAALLLAGCQGAESQQAAVAKPTASPVASPSSIPSVPALVKAHFQALGTEPFWSLEVLDGQLRYSSPDNPDGTTFPAVGRKAGDAYTYSGMMEGKSVLLSILEGTCSDGMSDTTYPYTATFTLDGKTERGCARLKPDV